MITELQNRYTQRSKQVNSTYIIKTRFEQGGFFCDRPPEGGAFANYTENIISNNEF